MKLKNFKYYKHYEEHLNKQNFDPDYVVPMFNESEISSIIDRDDIFEIFKNDMSTKEKFESADPGLEIE